MNYSQVNRFYYHLHSPTSTHRDCRSPSSPDEELTRLLQVTQTTSLNSTPRGSSSSSPLVRMSTGDLLNSNHGSGTMLSAEHRKYCLTLIKKQSNYNTFLDLLELLFKNIFPILIITWKRSENLYRQCQFFVFVFRLFRK